MRAGTLEISSKSIGKSSFRLSTKNAWAKYVRNRWRTNTLNAIQAEWDLTEGEARGVLYAQASQSTIDKILDREDERRPLGGFRLGLAILEIRTGTFLERYIDQLGVESEAARIEWEREEQRVAKYKASLARRDRDPRDDAEPSRADRPQDDRLGSGAKSPPVERRHFD